MKRTSTFIGLLLALLLLAACAPAETEVVQQEADNGDVDFLVYASPL